MLLNPSSVKARSHLKTEVSDIDRTTRNKRIIKWAVLVFFTIIVFTLQATPSFLEIFEIKPILLLPLAITIPMFEGEWSGGFAALGCGLLWDMSSESPFGSYGFLCLVAGVATGLLLKFLLRNEWFNCLFLVFVASFVVFSLEFLFTYAIYSYENYAPVFFTKHLPMILYTTAVSPIIYYIVKLIEKIKPEEF